MTKADLINVVSERASISKKDTGNVINECFNAMTEFLASGDKIQIVGFGTFEVKKRKERKGRNPSSGEEIIIPESKVVSFKAGKALKETVAQ